MHADLIARLILMVLTIRNRVKDLLIINHYFASNLQMNNKLAKNTYEKNLHLNSNCDCFCTYLQSRTLETVANRVTINNYGTTKTGSTVVHHLIINVKH
jgi:hypothetical protein